MFLIRTKSRKKQRTRGQALVEFALVIPVFLLVLAGILDFGFMLFTRMSVINAAREGARISVTASNPTTIPTIATGTARNAAFGLPAASVNVSAACIAIKSPGSCSFSTTTSSQAGDAVAITVSYDYSTFFPLFFGATIPMSATVQMVRE